MKEPIISVDRASKKIAIFDGPIIELPFMPYENEGNAIEKAKEMIRTKTDAEIRVVYPRITRMVCY